MSRPFLLCSAAADWPALRHSDDAETAVSGYEQIGADHSKRIKPMIMEKARENIELAHGEVSREVIGAFFHVYNALGYGLAESVYQKSIAIAIEMRGVAARREVPLQVVFEGRAVGEYRADLIVADKILVETKSMERLLREHEAQVYNYLKISGLRVGLLLNFGPKPVFRRLLRPVNQIPLR